MKKIITTAAKAIRFRRENRQLSRAALAIELGCTPQAIEAWEYGYRPLSVLLDDIAIKTNANLKIQFGGELRQLPSAAIKLLRKNMGLTQVEFAQKLDVSEHRVYAMERGQICPILQKFEPFLGQIYVEYIFVD